MKRARGCLVVAFIFGCGFLVGGFLGAAFGWVGFFHKVVKGGPDAVQQIIIERAKDDLGLKPEQRAAVAKIVEETAKELGDATAGVRPEVEEIMGRAADRVREVLDAGQRAKFDSFAKHGRRRWQVRQEPTGPQQPPAPAPETPQAASAPVVPAPLPEPQ